MGELIPGYHGPFSSTEEWHAAIIGAYDGMHWKKGRLEERRTENTDIDEEPHYYTGGYVAGNRVKWLGTGGLAAAVGPACSHLAAII